MLLTTELVPGGEEERRSPDRPSRRSQSKTPPASSRARHPRTPNTTAKGRTQGEEKEKERRKQQKEKRETQVKREKTGRVEVKVVDKTEEAVRSTVVDVDSVRATGGEVEEGEEEEERRWLLETDRQDGVKPRNLGVGEWLLMVLVLTLVILFLPLSIWFCFQVVREHERAVIFRLGHLLRGRARGPGLLFYLPWLDVCQKEDIRVKTLRIPSQTVVTRDLARVEVSSVCLYRVENVLLSTASLSSPPELLQALVQGALRDVLARHHFHHFLLNRKQVAREIRVAADSVAGRWGIRVERADIEEVSIPEELQQDMREQRDVQRQAQIKVTAAEGERAACQALRESLDSLSGSPAAVQLRLLQLLLTLRQSERPPLLLTLPPDLLSMTHDLSQLPPPPPPLSAAEEVREEGERETDSPMM
ncbi:hypothetical protein NHX12_002143 [Muraenolepis orangiensis]|uniref:Podocin n=1 Tax=Muraenolepis orangiensis TaxID=630683 RepID=A0A9Q0E3X1_9TELE|nr:hypothetical protein NHX12_002143 [Muraenolepis orangiensis]